MELPIDFKSEELEAAQMVYAMFARNVAADEFHDEDSEILVQGLIAATGGEREALRITVASLTGLLRAVQFPPLVFEQVATMVAGAAMSHENGPTDGPDV